MSYVKFKHWEKEIYLKGYQDAVDKKDPRFPLKIKGIQPLQLVKYPQRHMDLEIITLLSQYLTGLSAEDIWQKLGISKGSFYLNIKMPLNQSVVIKDSTVRPVLYKLSPKKEVTQEALKV